MTLGNYEVLHLTQHWSCIGGRWYRDAIARRLTDGELRLISIPDES